MSIQEVRLQIKRGVELVLGDYGAGLIIALVAICCFGLGRLSALVEYRTPLGFGAAPVAAAPMGPSGMIVAQEGGALYFYPWCSGAQQIPVGAKIWFQSERAAQRAGYTPAKNCRGLSDNN